VVVDSCLLLQQEVSAFVFQIGIMQWLEKSGNGISIISRRCPIPGCGAVVAMSDLVVDDAIELEMERAQQMKRMTERNGNK
jgi:SUMO ligase MMS21 Smc5/6 complex component